MGEEQRDVRKTSGRMKLQVYLRQKLRRPKDTIMWKRKTGLHTLVLSKCSSGLKYHIFFRCLVGQHLYFLFLAECLSLPLCVRKLLDKFLSAPTGVECQETKQYNATAGAHTFCMQQRVQVCFGLLCLLYRHPVAPSVTGKKKETLEPKGFLKF